MNDPQPLPAKFALIESIASIELRLTLKNRVSDIIGIVKAHGNTPPNIKTKEMVDRFLRHLESSCEKVETIRRRAEWLTTYSDIVLRNLNNAHFGRRDGTFLKVKPADYHFVHKVTALIEAVARYRVDMQGDPDRDADVLAVLEEILDRSEEVIPVPVSDRYQTLVAHIDRCRDTVKIFNNCGAKGADEYEYIVLGHLFEIQHILKGYLLQQNDQRAP